MESSKCERKMWVLEFRYVYDDVMAIYCVYNKKYAIFTSQ